MEERTSFDCGNLIQPNKFIAFMTSIPVKKLDFGHNREKIESDGFSVSTEPKEEDKKDIVVYSNLIQRSWSSTDFPNVKSERLETRSKSCQKLHQYDYCAIYKRKREEKRKRMEEEIKAQANSFKSRPMPNFMSRKPIKTPLKITLPITPEVLKRTKDTKVQRKQKVCCYSFFMFFC